jgi:hypothetical protein
MSFFPAAPSENCPSDNHHKPPGQLSWISLAWSCLPLPMTFITISPVITTKLIWVVIFQDNDDHDGKLVRQVQKWESLLGFWVIGFSRLNVNKGYT